MPRSIGSCDINMKNIFLYPTVSDKDYNSNIKNLIKQIEEERPISKKKEKGFNLMKHQIDVSHAFNLFSNSKSLLLLCEMGSGKTILSINLIENMKSLLIDHNTKALILVPNQLIENVFYSELLGLVGDKYEKRVSRNTYVDKNLRNKLNETLLNSIERKKLEKVALKKIKEVYEIVTHKRWEQYVLTLSDEAIINEFSNRIIVVDELHKAKNQNSNLYIALQKVLLLARNVWFIGMNAERHIIDDPKELCQYANLLHFNNTKNPKIVLSDEVIDNFFSTNPFIKAQSEKDLMNALKGLIVFVDGHDPKWFPTRIDVGYTQNEINKHYPNNYIKGPPPQSAHKAEAGTISNSQHHIGKPEIFLRPVELKDKTCEDYIYAFIGEVLNNKDLDPNEMWSKSRRYCRSENIFEAIWNDAQGLKIKGPIVVYCFFVEEGMFLFEEFLKTKGVKPFEDNTDHKCKTKKKVDYFFNFSRPYSNSTILKAIKVCQHPSNKNGERIKWILGTKKIGIGITLTNTARVCAIGSEWNNYNQDQFFGRCIRIGSHPENSKIEVIKYCSVLSKNSIETISPLVQAQLNQFVETNKTELIEKGFLDKETNHLKSVDEYMYSEIVWQKYIKTNELEMFVKKCAMLAFDLSQPLSIVENSASPNIKDLFIVQPLWHINELHSKLHISDNDVTRFLTKLEKYVKKQSLFNGWQGKEGYIKYLGLGYYQFVDKTSLSNSEIKGKLLQEYIQPINFWDVLFPMKDEYKHGTINYLIPDSFQKNLFILGKDLRLILTEEYPTAGVFGNTSTHPNTYQFKIVTNATESVCSDKSITEIYNVANKLHIDVPNFKNRKCRNNIVEVVFKGMKERNLIIPWSPNKRPSLLRLYKISVCWSMNNTKEKIVNLHQQWVSNETNTVSEWMIKILKSQNYWDDDLEYTRAGKMKIPENVIEALSDHISKNELYIFKLLDQTNCERPKRFSETTWDELVKPLKKYLHEKYKTIIAEIEGSIKLEIERRIV